MHGGRILVGSKIGQAPVRNPFDRPDSLYFQEVFEFVEPGG